jgi:hypothetical protein
MLAFAVLAMSGLILASGLAVDGGYAWSRRRVAQNAADLSALAGTRMVVRNIANLTGPGTSSMKYVSTDADVVAEINRTLADNGAGVPAYGDPTEGPMYVDQNGAPLTGSYAFVGNGIIPAEARGVLVHGTVQWSPFLLGILGGGQWKATADATARGTYIPPSTGGAMFAAAVIWPAELPTLASIPGTDHGAQPGWIACSAGGNGACPKSHYRIGTGDVGGGQFGWLGWSGATSAPGLCKLLTPGAAAAPSYTVPVGSSVTIPGNPGKKNPPCIAGAIAQWAASNATVFVPVASPGPGPCPKYCYPGTTRPYPPTINGSGANATYNILGFAGFQLVTCSQPCIDYIEAVYRGPFFIGPTDGASITTQEDFDIRLVG